MLPPQSEREARRLVRQNRRAELNQSMLFNIHGVIDGLFDRFTPPLSPSIPIIERLTMQEEIDFGTRTLNLATSKGDVSLSTRREDVPQGSVTDIRRLRIAEQRQTIILGFGYGRVESDALEQAPQYPPTVSRGEFLPYIPHPAKARSLTTRQIDEIYELVTEIRRTPDSQIIFTATPGKRIV